MDGKAGNWHGGEKHESTGIVIPMSSGRYQKWSSAIVSVDLHGYSIKRLLAPWTDTADLPQLKLRIHRAQRNLYGTITRSPLDNLSRLAITFCVHQRGLKAR